MRWGVALGTLVVLASGSGAAVADENDDWVAPVVRLGMGPAIHLAPEADEGVNFALDAAFGTKGPITGRLVTALEVGYGFDAIGTHAFQATAGLGYGTHRGGFTIQPRLLLGSGDDTFLIGMRNSIIGYTWYDTFNLEVGHQFASYGDTSSLHHSVQVRLHFNPAGLIMGLVRNVSGFDAMRALLPFRWN